MYKLYFKQAVQMLKQNRFVSIISIVGTALAIMMIMTIIVTDTVRNISMPPEANRDRTLYSPFHRYLDGKGGNSSMPIPYNVISSYLYKLKTPELVTAIENSDDLISTSDSRMLVNTVNTDANFWKTMSFHFIEGRAFSEEEFQSGIKNAVISENTAKTIFKNESALGKTAEINFTPYKIVGVVKDVSMIFNDAYGQVWIPYTSTKDYQERLYKALLLAKDKKDFASINNEVRDMEKKYHIENDPAKIIVQGPFTRKVQAMDIWAFEQDELADKITLSNRKKAFILMLLLLVPAINLSGLNFSRINKRTVEIGVRKAFGAKKHIILFQVLYENMITSLIGGLTGLLLSYAVVYNMRYWLLYIPYGSENVNIPVSSVISFPVLIGVFTVCITINLLSAGIPAYKAANMNIIDSINQNEK